MPRLNKKVPVSLRSIYLNQLFIYFNFTDIAVDVIINLTTININRGGNKNERIMYDNQRYGFTEFSEY